MKSTVRIALISIIAAAILLTGCVKKEKSVSDETSGYSGSYAFGGSTTLMPIFEAAIEEFTEIYPEVSISYDALGSSAGVKGVIAGTYSLGAASRELKESEINNGAEYTTVALDGVAVIVNKKSVPLDNLTIDQLIGIYSGEITNWKELGGPDNEIVVFNRDEASGTRSAFSELTIEKKNKSFLPEAGIVTSNGDMVSKIGATPYSVGYCGFGYLAKDPGTKGVSINGIAPTEENVINGTFPISRPLNVVYKRELAETEKAFLDYLLSEDGQKIVGDLKFIPLQ